MMAQFIKHCPLCGQLLTEKLISVDVEEEVEVCHAESIPVLVCENEKCSNQERYFTPFSSNLLKFKCPEINKW